ncbi:MAG: DUF933 domain-containing protein, partial [Spirochaetota bacterium]
EKQLLREYGLISLKPVLYCANVDEASVDDLAVQKLVDYSSREHSEFLAIAGKLEEEISELPPEDKQEFLQGMGLQESGLKRLIKASYRLLGLITYYTAETQLQAWTLPGGSTALAAAGQIHSDFEKGFIRAEVYNYRDLMEAGSEPAVREQGKLRSEGKEYMVQDGDIIRFLFNV